MVTFEGLKSFHLFLKILFFFLIGAIVFRYFFPYALRFFIVRWMKKMNEKQTQSTTTNPEKTKKSKSENLGEYIDYEEIE